MVNLPTISLSVCAVSLFLVGCTGIRPDNLGVRDGKLAPCPSTPNCASSQSTDAEHAVAPLPYTGPAGPAIDDLKKIILAVPRTRIIAEQHGYLRAEFSSLIFRFVDDVEFYANEPLQRIEVRSASRLGRSDLGVNRKRIEEIRARLQELRR